MTSDDKDDPAAPEYPSPGPGHNYRGPPQERRDGPWGTPQEIGRYEYEIMAEEARRVAREAREKQERLEQDQREWRQQKRKAAVGVFVGIFGGLGGAILAPQAPWWLSPAISLAKRWATSIGALWPW